MTRNISIKSNTNEIFYSKYNFCTIALVNRLRVLIPATELTVSHKTETNCHTSIRRWKQNIYPFTQ